jgi:hypothetical protein
MHFLAECAFEIVTAAHSAQPNCGHLERLGGRQWSADRREGSH